MKYHEKTPPRLKKLLRKYKGNQSAAAKEINVNSAHISKLVKKGIEPVDSVIRVRMFLPAHPICKYCGRKIIHRKKIVKQDQPDLYAEYKKKWRKLPQAHRNKAIAEFITWYDKNGSSMKE